MYNNFHKAAELFRFQRSDHMRSLWSKRNGNTLEMWKGEPVKRTTNWTSMLREGEVGNKTFDRWQDSCHWENPDQKRSDFSNSVFVKLQLRSWPTRNFAIFVKFQFRQMLSDGFGISCCLMIHGHSLPKVARHVARHAGNSTASVPHVHRDGHDIRIFDRPSQCCSNDIVGRNERGTLSIWLLTIFFFLFFNLILGKQRHMILSFGTKKELSKPTKTTKIGHLLSILQWHWK